MTQTLDVRTLAPPVRHPRIFETFDALGPGESFVLLNDHYPLPLLYQFQAERADAFDWSVLEARGGLFRVEIRRRDARGARCVDEYLTWDHRRLDALLDAVKELVSSGSLAEARARFAEFRCGLERHIVAEEGVLFPAFEEHAGPSGPTVVMRMEHATIREAMAEIAEALEAGAAAAFGVSVERLEAALGEHNVKEERVLYPMIDRIAGPAGAIDLVRRMQVLPA